MAKTIESLFIWLTFISDLILLVSFLFFLQKKKFRPIWLIAIYTLINFSINLFLEFFPFDNVLFVYSCFTFIEYFLFTSFIYLLIKNTVFKKLMLFLSIAFAFFLPIYYKFFFQGASIDSIPIGVETLLILVFSFYYFYEQMSDLENHFIYNRYHFWIITGIMIYLAGSFFIYISANNVDKEIQGQLWFLTYFFYVVKNVFFIIGITSYNKKSKSRLENNLKPYLN